MTLRASACRSAAIRRRASRRGTYHVPRAMARRFAMRRALKCVSLPFLFHVGVSPMNVRFGLVALVLGVAAVLSSANSASAFFGHGCGCNDGCGHRCCLFNLFHKHDCCCEPCCCEETCGCEASCGCAAEASCAAAEEPSCGCAAEASCGCESSCGCEASCCDPCCKPRRCCILGCLGRLFHRHRCCAPSCCEASCGCDAAPSCGCGG